MTLLQPMNQMIEPEYLFIFVGSVQGIFFFSMTYLPQGLYGARLLFFVSARTNKRHHHHHHIIIIFSPGFIRGGHVTHNFSSLPGLASYFLNQLR
jgi:hypothetical protein